MVITRTATKVRAVERIQIVDYYRFCAALMVLAGHFFVAGISIGMVDSISIVPPVAEIAKYGYLGVDLFFLISGYVITQSAWGKSARQFVVGRAVRLYPAFWVGLLLTSAVTVLWGAPHLHVTAPQVLANVTMVPGILDQPPVDSVYWTLLFEIKFYALIGVLVLCNQAKRINVIMPIWAIGMAVASFAFPAIAGRVDFLGNFYLLFASGAIIAAIRASGWTPLRASALLAAFAASIPFEITRAFGIGDKLHHAVDPTVIVAVLAGFLILMLLTTLAGISDRNLPGSATLGALTYPVYLIHTHIGYIIFDRFATDENKWLVYGVAYVAIILVLYVIHQGIERRMRGYWFRLFDGTIGRLTDTAEDLLLRRSRGTS